MFIHWIEKVFVGMCLLLLKIFPQFYVIVNAKYCFACLLKGYFDCIMLLIMRIMKRKIFTLWGFVFHRYFLYTSRTVLFLPISFSFLRCFCALNNINIKFYLWYKCIWNNLIWKKLNLFGKERRMNNIWSIHQHSTV